MLWLQRRLQAFWERLDLIGDDPGFEEDWETVARSIGLLPAVPAAGCGEPHAA